MSDGALIVTAELPHDLHRWATDLRTTHFPPERNYLEAHVTLFHALPAMCEDELKGLLKRLAAEYAPIDGHLEGLMSLGGGTALRLSSPGMLECRELVAEHFHGMLTAQDQHKPRLHVTIQNKVSSKVAKALQAELAPKIAPQPFRFRALSIYRYMGGPWDGIATYPFRGRAVE